MAWPEAYFPDFFIRGHQSSSRTLFNIRLGGMTVGKNPGAGEIFWEHLGENRWVVVCTSWRNTLWCTLLLLSVPVSHPLLTISVPGNQIFIGDIVELHCEDKRASPPILYSFYHENISLGNISVSSGGGVSFNLSLTAKHNGNYFCEASNGLVAQRSEMVALNITGRTCPKSFSGPVGIMSSNSLFVLFIEFPSPSGNHSSTKKSLYSQAFLSIGLNNSITGPQLPFLFPFYFISSGICEQQTLFVGHCAGISQLQKWDKWRKDTLLREEGNTPEKKMKWSFHTQCSQWVSRYN